MFELESGQSTLVLCWVFTVFVSGFSCKYSLKSSLHRQWYKYKDLSTVKIELKSSSGWVKCSLQHNQFSPWIGYFFPLFLLFFILFALIFAHLWWFGGCEFAVLDLAFVVRVFSWRGLGYETSWGFLSWGSPFNHRRVILGKKKLSAFL